MLLQDLVALEEAKDANQAFDEEGVTHAVDTTEKPASKYVYPTLAAQKAEMANGISAAEKALQGVMWWTCNRAAHARAALHGILWNVTLDTASLDVLAMASHHSTRPRVAF